MNRRNDGLDGPTWHEFERLRYEKTPALQQKFGSFGIYWNFLQATAGSQAAVCIILDQIICVA